MKGKYKLKISYTHSTLLCISKMFVSQSFFNCWAGWPKSHNFEVFKLEIENIFMINWFGDPKPLTVDQYLHAKM